VKHGRHAQGEVILLLDNEDEAFHGELKALGAVKAEECTLRKRA
jgi:hypothetical protein